MINYTLTPMTIKTASEMAADTVAKNRECFVAQWILMNPEKNPADYVKYP